MADERDFELIEEEEEEVVTFVDEDGNEIDFDVIAVLDYKDLWYIYLSPVKPTEGFEEGDLFICRIDEDENSEELYVPVEDEALLSDLMEEFDKLVESEEDEDAASDDAE